MEHTHKTGRGGTTAAQDKTFSYLITGLEKSTEFNWTNISDFRKLQGAHSCALLKSTLENRGGGHAQHALGLLPYPRNSFDRKLIADKQKIQIAIMKKTLPGSRGADRDRRGHCRDGELRRWAARRAMSAAVQCRLCARRRRASQIGRRCSRRCRRTVP